MATIYGKGSGTTAWGTSWADTIFVKGAAGGYGQGGDDRLYGDGAANKLVGGAGSDFADGGAGNDWLDGQDGADSLFGGTGDDIIHGGAGNDWVAGGLGIDRVSGGAGNDRIDLYQGATDYQAAGTARGYVNGGDGRDVLNVNASDAAVDGAAVEYAFLHWGSDRLYIDFSAWTGDAAVADARNVEVVAVHPDGPALAYSGSRSAGHEGDAVGIVGTRGDDAFTGGVHSEAVDLGAGADTFYVSVGIDSVRLGDGADTLVLDRQYALDPDGDPGTVRTRVEDFDPGADTIDASRWPDALEAVDMGADTLVRGDGVEVLFVGVGSPDSLDPFIG